MSRLYFQTPRLASIAPTRISPATTPRQHRRELFSTVASRTYGPRTVVAAVQEPRVRTTKWNLGGHHHDRVLSIPRMIFFICLFRGGFENVYAYFLKQPYSGSFSALYHSIFPNSDSSGWICMGTGPTRDAIIRETLRHTCEEAKVDTVLYEFWQGSHFNTDLMDRFTDHAPQLHPDLSSIASWERASRIRPGFIHDVSWEFATTATAVFDQLRRAQ